MTPSNAAFAIFGITLVIGCALIWLPLGFIAASSVALVLSIATARTGDR